MYINNLTLDPKKPQLGLSYLVTHFNRKLFAGDIERVREAYQVDPKEKRRSSTSETTVLDLLDAAMPWVRVEAGVRSLARLKAKYNVILRPHPMQHPRLLERLREDFTITRHIDFLSLYPFYEVADVIIGTPGSGGSNATFYAAKPLVLAQPSRSWGGHDFIATAERNGNLVLNSSSAVLVDERTMDYEQAVEKALNDPRRGSRIKGRKQYFRYTLRLY